MGTKCFLTVLLSFLTFASAAGTKNDTVRLYDAAGSNKILIDMYLASRDTDRCKAMEYAGLLLERIDPATANPVLASISDELSEYYEKDLFLFSKAIKYRERSLMIYSSIGDSHAAAVSRYRLARLNYYTGQYHRTLAYANEALEYFRESGERDIVLDCLNLLGIVNYFCKDFTHSTRYFTKCAEEARKTNDSLRLMLALNNLAAYENNEKVDTAKARSLIREGIEICRNTKDSANLFRMYLNLANSYLSTHEAENAGIIIEQMKGMADDIQQKGLYFLQLGGYHFYLGEYGKTIAATDSAIFYLEKGDFDQKIQNCLNIQWMAYEHTGNYKKAYEAVTRYIDIEDSLSKEDVYLQIFRLQQDKIRQEAKAARNKRICLIAFFTTVGILAATSIILLIYMKYRKKMYTVCQQEYELRAKDAIMEIRQIQQYQINRLIETVNEKLTRLSLNVKDKKVREAVSEISKDLVNSKDESQWKEIKEFVPVLNNDSFQKLIKDFPNLTVNERRLCILLNKNLSTKEISMITRQSVNSITVARARLRNKFGLTGSPTSLQEFLSRYN